MSSNDVHVSVYASYPLLWDRVSLVAQAGLECEGSRRAGVFTHLHPNEAFSICMKMNALRQTRARSLEFEASLFDRASSRSAKITEKPGLKTKQANKQQTNNKKRKKTKKKTKRKKEKKKRKTLLEEH